MSASYMIRRRPLQVKHFSVRIVLGVDEMKPVLGVAKHISTLFGLS